MNATIDTPTAARLDSAPDVMTDGTTHGPTNNLTIAPTEGPCRMYVLTATVPELLTISGASMFATESDAMGWGLNRVREILCERDDLPSEATVNVVVASLTDEQAAALLAQVSLLRPDLFDQAALRQLELDAHGPHEPK